MREMCKIEICKQSNCEVPSDQSNVWFYFWGWNHGMHKHLKLLQLTHEQHKIIQI